MIKKKEKKFIMNYVIKLVNVIMMNFVFIIQIVFYLKLIKNGIKKKRNTK